MDLLQLSDIYLKRREEKERAEEAAKAARELMEQAERAMIDFMTLDDNGITSFKREDGVSLSLVRKTQYSVEASNKDELYERLRADGMEYLFTVASATLNKTMKEMALEQDDGMLPERYADIITPYEQMSLSVRGRKKG